MIYQKINSMFAVEKLLKFKRFDFNNIKSENIDETKILLLKNIKLFQEIFKNKNNRSNTQSINFIKNKIAKINDENLLCKFIEDCYNNISEHTVNIKYSRIKINNK